MEEKKRIGFAMCGSYCTYAEVFYHAEKLAEKYNIVPIMSDTAAETLRQLESFGTKPDIAVAGVGTGGCVSVRCACFGGKLLALYGTADAFTDGADARDSL